MSIAKVTVVSRSRDLAGGVAAKTLPVEEINWRKEQEKHYETDAEKWNTSSTGNGTAKLSLGNNSCDLPMRYTTVR